MNEFNWNVCNTCFGLGSLKRKINKKTKSQYQISYQAYLKNPLEIKEPVPPKASSYSCVICEGTGIIKALHITKTDSEKFPNVAIIGLGIGGIALAVACLHRGIPFKIYERDLTFNTRSQGYGLTLQQASKALKFLGISNLNDGIVSTRHIVFNLDKTILGEWGVRKWLPNTNNKIKRSNVHIARQSLRLALLNELKIQNCVYWNHQLVEFKTNRYNTHTLDFLVDGEIKQFKADLIVGADGIRSKVRHLIFENDLKPLRYLGCMVILGICSLDKLQYLDTDLLDNATVFQTANGRERIYLMPYSNNKIMWQFSFSISENKAKELSKNGANHLKKVVQAINWHNPIPQIIDETTDDLITGYPVYDRPVLSTELKETNKNVTLIGDAAHPMSPFKGQGANQALLDALALARDIYKKYNFQNWNSSNLRTDVLNDFEANMLERSAVKVIDSAAAAKFLHSNDVLKIENQPRRSSNSEDTDFTSS